MKKLICMLISAVLIFLCSCSMNNENNSKDNYSDNALLSSENNGYEQDLPLSETHLNTENLTRMGIRDAKEFRDGYALIEIEDENDVRYYAVVDKEGNVKTCFEKGLKYFRESFEGKFYFYEDLDKGIRLFCVNDKGNTVYEKILLKEDSSSYKFTFGSDGTLFLLREQSGYADAGSTQYMWISPVGKVLKDWSDVYYEGQKINPNGIIYRNDGLSILVDKDNGTFLLNINKDEIYKLDIVVSDNNVSELMGGYLYINEGYDHYVLSSEGVLTESKFSPFNRLKYSSEASDAVVYCSEEYSLYDASLTNKIAEVDVPEICKDKPEETTECSYFKNGYAAFIFLGENEKQYLTLIDTNGNFKFEPILLENSFYLDPNKLEYNCFWDGERIIVRELSRYKIYDLNGIIEKEIVLSDYNGYSYGMEIGKDQFSESLLPIVHTERQPGTEYPDKDYCYLKSDGSILFPEGAVYVSP